jgi:hypothetical protein
MLLDAVLLSMAKITSRRNADTSVAILPEMRLTTGDGIVVANPDTNFQAWLTGHVDYGVVQYLDQDDNKAQRAHWVCNPSDKYNYFTLSKIPFF